MLRKPTPEPSQAEGRVGTRGNLPPVGLRHLVGSPTPMGPAPLEPKSQVTQVAPLHPRTQFTETGTEMQGLGLRASGTISRREQ